LGYSSIICYPFWLAGLPLILGEVVNWISGIASPDDEAQFLFGARCWATITIVIVATMAWLRI